MFCYCKILSRIAQLPFICNIARCRKIRVVVEEEERGAEPKREPYC